MTSAIVIGGVDPLTRAIAEKLRATRVGVVVEPLDIDIEALRTRTTDRPVSVVVVVSATVTTEGADGALDSVRDAASVGAAVGARRPAPDEPALIEAVAAMLGNRSGGSLVVVGPAGGLSRGLGPNASAAAGGALIGAVRHATATWAARGLAANLVVVGAVGAGTEAGRRRGPTESVGARAVTTTEGRSMPDHPRHPSLLGRRVEVDEVAEVVAFLGSQPAAFVNGAVIPVDGGASMGLL